MLTSAIYAQCPENIGFENGNFQNWKFYTGIAKAINKKNANVLSEVAASDPKRHLILDKTSQLDPYGLFKVVPEDGGNFAVKLGNDGVNAQAEAISYVIDVPLNRPEFTVTYQYAVVLEDPDHIEIEQPRFIARIKDLEKDEYITCASYEYIATSNLPGFKKSALNSNVIYKDWTPVTLNLSGYQGKKLLLEFITQDCLLGGHFGYAYVDVNNVCGDAITGNSFCKNADEVKVKGPDGFFQYNWYSEDRKINYGSGQSIAIKPAPSEGSKVLLDLVPYEGYGCPSTVSTTLHSVDYQLSVLEQKSICANTLVDLNSTEFILNKNPDFSYFIYDDNNLTHQITNTVLIQNDQTFYVKATNFSGCESVATISIKVNNLNKVTLRDPAPVCFSETVNLTSGELFTNVQAGTKRSYFLDETASRLLTDPEHVAISGTYYVKLENELGCTRTLPVLVQINSKPVLTIRNPLVVCAPETVDLTQKNNFEGSDADLVFSFFEDQDFKTEVANPRQIQKSGIYFVRATNSKNCIVVGKIEVKIAALPVFVVKNPEPVCFSESVDLTNAALVQESSAGLTISYFSDATLSKTLKNASHIGTSGTYYIKAENEAGCSVSAKVEVVIYPQPEIVLHQPSTVLESTSINLTNPEIIQGSKNYHSVAYFEDSNLQKPVSNPSSVKKSGTYYIALNTEKGCSVSAALHVEIAPTPKILVPTAFTPQKLTNNHLSPFFVSIQKLISFKVYNKWGVLVFQTSDMKSEGWDGQFQSKMQSLETFSWFAEAIDVTGAKLQSNGKTVLIL